MRFLRAPAPVFIVTLPAECPQVPPRRSCAAGSPRQYALQLMSRHVRSLPQPSRAHFTLPRYNLGAFLLVHRPSQQDEAASLLRSAHSVRKVVTGSSKTQVFLLSCSALMIATGMVCIAGARPRRHARCIAIAAEVQRRRTAILRRSINRNVRADA